MRKLEIIELQDKEKFKEVVSLFCTNHCLITSKFQRNLYYGVSGSSGQAPVEKGELKETYVAFILYEE